MADDSSYQLAHIKQSRVPSLITSGAICLSAAYIAFTLRLVSRRLAHVRFEADDWCMVLGLVSCHLNTGFESMDIAYHSYNLPDIYQCLHHQHLCPYPLRSWSPCSAYRETYRIHKGIHSISSLYSRSTKADYFGPLKASCCDTNSLQPSSGSNQKLHSTPLSAAFPWAAFSHCSVVCRRLRPIIQHRAVAGRSI